MSQYLTQHQNAKSDFRALLRFGLWTVNTTVLALFAPYALLAVLSMMFWLLGTPVELLRQNIVGIATMDAQSWRGMATFWENFALFCAVVVVIWRVMNSSVFYHFLNHIEHKSISVIRPMQKKISSMSISQNQKRMIVSVMVLMTIFGGYQLISSESLSPKNIAPKPLSLNDPIVKPNVAAAITMADGSIKSGNAVITKGEGDSYVVTFTRDK